MQECGFLPPEQMNLCSPVGQLCPKERQQMRSEPWFRQGCFLLASFLKRQPFTPLWLTANSALSNGSVCLPQSQDRRDELNGTFGL